MFRPCGGSSNFRRLLKFCKFLAETMSISVRLLKARNAVNQIREFSFYLTCVCHNTYQAGSFRENIDTHFKGEFFMFRSLRISQDSMIVLDPHTTSPGKEAPSPDRVGDRTPSGDPQKAPIREPKTDLYIRANQFYLRSRLSRLRKSSSTII